MSMIELSPKIQSINFFPVYCKICNEKFAMYMFKEHDTFKNSIEVRENIICSNCMKKIFAVDPNYNYRWNKLYKFSKELLEIANQPKIYKRVEYNSKDKEFDFISDKAIEEKDQAELELWFLDTIELFDDCGILSVIPDDMLSYYELLQERDDEE